MIILRVMRFLFWVLVLSWSVALLRRVVARLLRGAQPPASAVGLARDNPENETSRRLVRDPVCGMHVAEFRAIPMREGAQVLHFCSTSCRDQYISSTKKLAAAG